ncbi:MAG: DUF3501 family protein [Candidatus Binatia bacterium]
MKKVTLDDIMGLPTYEKVRDSFRRRIIELKKKRRISVGNKVSLVFENRDTVIFQIQEMLRAEKVTDLDKIREEIEVYNSLIPEARELSATLFLEIEDQSHLRDELLKFLGIDEAVFLKIGNSSIHARFEGGHSKEDKISAVQYVRFPFSQEGIQAFMEGKEEAALLIDHPNYQAKATIGPETRKSLVEDLMS